MAVSGLFGFVVLACVTLAIQDLDAAAVATNPFMHVIETALGGTFGRVVLWVVTLAMWFCGLSCVTSTSRMVFAFARDQGLPWSQTWSRVSRRWRTPAAAVWLACGLSFALPCLIIALVALFPRRLSFATLYPAVTGLSTIGLYLSYGLPLLLKQRAIRRGLWSPRANGPWNLGRWSRPVNWIALAWIGFISVLFVLPPNELTGWIFGATIALMAGYYGVAVRRHFRGPVPQAASREDLLKLEAELEQQPGSALAATSPSEPQTAADELSSNRSGAARSSSRSGS